MRHWKEPSTGLKRMATSNALSSTSRSSALPLAVVAASDLEIRPIKKCLGRQLISLVSGEGPQKAGKSLKAFLDWQPVRLVLNVGLAGALSERLRPADLIVANRIQYGTTPLISTELAAQAAQLRPPSGHLYLGTFLTVPEVACTAAEKRRLASQLAEGEIGCVEMESGCLAGICAERGIPFLAVRSISDLATEDLPFDFNLCRDKEGGLDQRKIMRMAMLRPCSWLQLWQLFRRSRQAARQLAWFVSQYLQV